MANKTGLKKKEKKEKKREVSSKGNISIRSVSLPGV